MTEKISFSAAPMYSFEEWVNTTAEHDTVGAVHKWANQLIEIGASWDSFRRSSEEVVTDLVAGGIPLLAARDIYIVASKVVAQTTMPMAIFWDLENIAIPSDKTASEVVTRLKKLLAPHGNLSQFRGYASIGLGNIPEHKRSELQLGGCTLVDCPHLGRKEVADKMIIIDAMEFAFSNPSGATLCFITGDVDYAYLLAVLQKNPELKTIVISKGTIQSMLHYNAHMKMRWETDILMLRSNTTPRKNFVPPPPGFENSSNSQEVKSSNDETYAGVLQSSNDCKSDDATSDSEGLNIGASGSMNQLEVLTYDEGWTDDAELLRTIVRKGSNLSSVTMGEGTSAECAMKSIVSSMLREVNPARFPDRESVQQFLYKAVETSVVIEVQEGSNKLLHLPLSGVQSAMSIPSISLSDSPPSGVDMQPKTLEMAKRLPFILFAPKGCAPNQGDIFPPKAFVQTSICKRWFILMFSTLTLAQRAVSETTWLKSSTLVDWRRALKQNQPSRPVLPATEIIQKMKCETCDFMYPRTDILYAGEANNLHCYSCFLANKPWPSEERLQSIDNVTKTLKMMAENDDYCVNEGILKKTLLRRYPLKCASKKQASVWIEEALQEAELCIFKREGIKSKQLYLPIFEELAKASLLKMNTDEQEEYVIDLLWKNGGWLPRHDVVASLKDNFESMNSLGARVALFFNARESEKFFVARGPFAHTCGLTYDDAVTALEMMETPSHDDEGMVMEEQQVMAYSDETDIRVSSETHGIETNHIPASEA